MGVLIGKKAPHFEAEAVLNGNQIVENFSLDQYLGEKYVIFYFYPADWRKGDKAIKETQESISDYLAN
ncbi:MAG: redoxin domain-containing protein [Bacteroidales bacterium]